jgi:hypothetical protein
MTAFRFDPSRLARSPKQQERDGYALAGQMLRDSLGGVDIFAEVRRWARRDPRLREMLRAVAADLALATVQIDPLTRKDDEP